MEMIKNQWRMRRSEVSVTLAVMAAVYVMGMLLFGSVKAGDEQMRAVPVGTLLACVIGGIMHVLCGCFSMSCGFNLAVSMGITRKRFVSSYMFFSICELVGVVLVASAFCAGELFINRISFAGVSAGAQEVSFALPKEGELLLYAAVVLLGMLASEMILSALLMRFGSNVMWVMWIVPGVGVPMTARWICSLKLHVTAEGVAAVFACVCVILLLVSWRMLKRQQVTL